MPYVTIHVRSGDWCIHFVETATQTPCGPWLLFDSFEEVTASVFAWAQPSAEQLEHCERALQRWGVAAVHVDLTPQQLTSLRARKRRWPWNGYELLRMKAAGRYPGANSTQKLASNQEINQNSE